METEKIAYMWLPETNTIAEFNTNTALSVPEEFLGKYCVDNNFTHGDDNRFGMWGDKDRVLNGHTSSWVHIPFEEFPIEFKTRLLLLGITS